MIHELRAFLLRGNVIDLAVAVVIGAAFTAIVTAIVTGIITPLIGLLFGNDNFGDYSEVVRGQEFLIGGVISAIVNFVAVGTILFFVVKAANTATALRKTQVAAQDVPPEIPEDVALLREIRDALVAPRGAVPSGTPPPPPAGA